MVSIIVWFYRMLLGAMKPPLHEWLADIQSVFTRRRPLTDEERAAIRKRYAAQENRTSP